MAHACRVKPSQERPLKIIHGHCRVRLDERVPDLKCGIRKTAGFARVIEGQCVGMIDDV